MRFLLILLLPIILFSAPSENDTCYTKFTVPNIKDKYNDISLIHLCINGYSYIYNVEYSISGGMALQQIWIIVNDQEAKSIPQTCSCEDMGKLSDNK